MQETGMNWAQFGLVMLGLVVAGSVYAYGTRLSAKHETLQGYTFVFVIGGVVLTLAGAVFLVGLTAALLVGACFVATGLPMIVESIGRHAAERKADREKARRATRELLDG